MKKILILFVLVVSIILGTPNTKTTVTSVRNNVTVSIPTGEISKTSNVNDETKKEIAKLKLEIKVLRDQLIKQEEENKKKEQQLKQDLEQKINEKIEKNINLTYSIDQIYSTSKSHYEDSIKRVEDLYSASFSSYNNLIIAFLTGLGILVAFAVFVKFDDSKKMKELRDELLCDMKYKKEEIEKYMDKVMETSITCMKEIVNAKTSELDDLKLKIEEMNKTLDKELIRLDNKTVEKINILKLESEKAINYINNLSKEIKTALKTEKERITNHENEIKEVTNQIEKLKKSTISDVEIIEEPLINNKVEFLGKAKQLYKDENYEEAIVTLKENYITNDYEVNYLLGKNYYMLKNYKEAIKYYSVAKKCEESVDLKSYLNFDIGTAYYFDGNYKDALESFISWNQSAVDSDSQSSSKLWMGITQYAMEKYEEAINNLEEIKNENRIYWLRSSYYGLAKKYYEEKNKKLAQINIIKSIDLDSTNKLALDLKEKIEKMLDDSDNKTEE